MERFLNSRVSYLFIIKIIMFGWSLKTSDEKKEAARTTHYSFIFQALLPSDILIHFDASKSVFQNKIFTNDAISFLTINDFYLDPAIAEKSTKKLLKQIATRSLNNDGYAEEEFEKLKNALLYMEPQKVSNLPWFL